MAEEKFVKRQIVLGAGASANDGGGYPLGGQLIEFICQDNGRFINDAFNEIVKNKPDIQLDISKVKADLEKFIQALKNSSAQSIDSFIARQSSEDMRNVGYSLIAGIILSFGLQKIDWYGNLLPLIFPPINIGDDEGKKIQKLKSKLEELRLVTFNYDLSLEKFLYDFLKYNYLSGSKEETIAEAFEALNEKVEHVYGSVIKKESFGEFFNSYHRVVFRVDGPEEGFNNSVDCFRILNQEVVLAVSNGVRDHGRYNFGAYLNKGDVIPNASLIWYNVLYASLNKSFGSIRIIEEERGGDESSCPQLINCDYIYVLGFGFDVENIRRINLVGSICKKQAFITNYEGNQKIERMAINILCRTQSSGRNMLIPIISHYDVKGALSYDFSFLEESESVEKIPLDKSLNGEYSPFIAYKSSLYSKTHNQKPHDQKPKN